MATPKDVAAWMVQQFAPHGLYQEIAVRDIRNTFGEAFIYKNASGNWAIDKEVLKEFRKLTRETVIWERGTRRWRKREQYDKPGRQQDR